MPTHRPARLAVVTCAILCLLYAIVSMGAAAKKSATYDEPLHVATGWLNLWRGDFRLSPDVPPLWEYWISLPLGRDALNFDATAADQSLDRRAVAALYQAPPASGVALVERSRWMSLPLAMLLLILVAVWAGELGGPAAAVAGAFVFAFDPNWLGHGALAKNDVAFALGYFASAYAAWRVGRRAGLGALTAIVILPAVCLGTKFSGLLLAPALAMTLGARAMMSKPWPVGSGDRAISGRRAKLALAAAICATAALAGYAAIWAEYQFRFDAGPDGRQLELGAMTRDLRDAEVRGDLQVNHPTPQQLAAWRPGVTTRGVLWLARRRLIPQALAGGILYVQTSARQRTAYLLGRLYHGGRFSYFPLAWLFKEPLCLIAAGLASCPLARRIRPRTWNSLALLIPAGVYAIALLTSDLNIGLRHAFAVMAFIDVGIALAAARIWKAARARGRWVVVLLAAGMMAETIAAYPDFISFFNVACGGERGGRVLLGDSNLDWGQDLPLLADWQRLHPNTPLYLDYFGTCDPAAYGIRYVNVIGGYVYGPPAGPASAPGIAAVSASKLQRLFVTDSPADFARQFEHVEPVDVLGGSIYLYPFPP